MHLKKKRFKSYSDIINISGQLDISASSYIKLSFEFTVTMVTLTYKKSGQCKYVNDRNQETADSMWMLSHVRCRSKHTTIFSINSKTLPSLCFNIEYRFNSRFEGTLCALSLKPGHNQSVLQALGSG
jgi:hypothetical protein